MPGTSSAKTSFALLPGHDEFRYGCRVRLCALCPRLRRALAAWCAADPGSIVLLVLPWIPALRSSVKHADRVRDTRGNCSSRLFGDLPVGRFVDRGVQPCLQKYFCFRTPQITSRTLRIPSRKRGVSRSSRTLGTGCDGRRQRLARDGIAGRVLRDL
jgi:hypothetical protein